MKQQSGFTLIELIMVIVILGVLAATALPKFVDLSSDATTNSNAYKAGAQTEVDKVKVGCEAIRGVGNCN